SGLGPAQGVRFPEVVNSPESLPQTPVDSDNPLPQKNSSSNRRTVLVAGNCQTVHKQIQMTLERYGLRVVYALDGPAAIQESARWNPSVILMDVSLPQLDGYQLCRLIRQQESMRQIPVVMLIDRDSLMSRLRGRMAGCSGCLAKPFTSEELVAVMERHVSESIEMIGTSG
ncbi:MAG: response regulator, partial [Planctomycetaceae bacterium]